MFYFQSMFQQVYNGITGSAVIPAVQQVRTRSYCWQRYLPSTKLMQRAEMRGRWHSRARATFSWGW